MSAWENLAVCQDSQPLYALIQGMGLEMGWPGYSAVGRG